MKDKAIKLLFDLVAPIFWVLSLISPKDDRIWIFGSWFGRAYNDNTKYLFQEAIHNPNIRAVWITKNREVIRQIRNIERAEAYYAYSINGLLLQLRARVFCMTVNSNDFYFAMLNPRNVQVQFWHGTPIKRVCFDAWHGFEFYKNLVRSKLVDSYDVLISPSKVVDKILLSAFRVNASNIVRSAYPRCDGLFISESERIGVRRELGVPDAHKLFVYMPTHRNEGARPEFISRLYEDFRFLATRFSDNNITVVMKPHFYEFKNSWHFQSVPGMCVVRDIDVYRLLGASDGLITDVSSVCFDYEVTRKPIVFYMPDVETYEKDDRETYFRLRDIANVVCTEREELMRELLLASSGRGEYGLKVNMNEDFNKKISERLLPKLIELIDIKLGHK